MKFITALLAAITIGMSGAAGAQGIAIAGIDHVGINVPDLKQAEDFFSATFGCAPLTHIGPFKLASSRSRDRRSLVAARADSVSLAMLRCASGANIELFEYKNSQGSTLMPADEDIGASHIAFYTDDVRAGAAYLKSIGITLLGEPLTMPDGDTEGETWVHFLSPWGAELELVGYPNGKGYEKTASRKLWHPKHPGN